VGSKVNVPKSDRQDDRDRGDVEGGNGWPSTGKACGYSSATESSGVIKEGRQKRDAELFLETGSYPGVAHESMVVTRYYQVCRSYLWKWNIQPEPIYGLSEKGTEKRQRLLL